MGFVSKEQERAFEKRHILRQEDRYLATDVLQRVQHDRGYSEKLLLIEGFLGDHRGGPILDLGANTSGEAEVLSHRGYPMVATDINEIALSLSKKRARKFGRSGPEYYAADAHRLPFDSNTFGSIVAFEVLHHFERLEVVLGEINRVLAPGGRLLAYEPFALNPYRRIAELRFLLLGSIERSFTVTGLRRHLETSGFEVDSVDRHVLPASDWKKHYATRFRAFLKDLYYATARRSLPIFGNILMVARKPGAWEPIDGAALETRLRCPITGGPLIRENEHFVTEVGPTRYRYPITDGIPVLIEEDAEPLSQIPP